jgi:hypothetical protein
MIFVKKLSTIAVLNKAKEDMMAEVIKREMAKMNIVALSQRWLKGGKEASVLKAQFAAQRTIRKYWSGSPGNQSSKFHSYLCFKKFSSIWYEYKTFGKAGSRAVSKS